MTRARRLLGAAAALAALLGSASSGLVTAAPAAARTAPTVTLSVIEVTPSTPVIAGKHPLSITLSVQNRTDRDLGRVTIDGIRGEPIESQAALDHAMRTPFEPASNDVSFSAARPVTVVLGPDARTSVTFTTYTSQADDQHGICLCHPHAVYPLYFRAHATDGQGVDQQLGVVATYLPAFDVAPEPVRVAWVWPLLDQPHRLTGSTVFTDDLLANEVSPGGRLARALDVVARVAGRVPLTLVLDPEILDELEVMAGPSYQVQVGGGRTAAGTGQNAAVTWLGELRDVLTAHPALSVVLTPYADPDVESLAREGLSWTDAIPVAMRAHVEQALAGHTYDTSVAWPAGGAVGSKALDALVAAGTSTLLLNSTAVTPQPAAGTVPPALTRVRSGRQDLAVGLLNPTLQRSVADAVALTGAGPAALPPLIAQLAVRAAQQPGREHAAVLAPPRYVDPSVTYAVRTIEDTSTSTFARPISLADAVTGPLMPAGHSRLARVPASAATLPDETLDAAAQASSTLPLVQAMLNGKEDAQVGPLLAGYVLAQQRIESAGWGRARSPGTGTEYARGIARQLVALTRAVKIVTPPSGSYTLASSSSELPITLENDGPYPVQVQVQVVADNGLLGFTARTTAAQVEANSKRTVHVPTQVDRSGRIKVQASLLTSQGIPVGDSVPLTVHSTALGVVGVVITIVAGVVLAAALLVRFGRRWRKRRRGPSRAPQVDPDVPAVPEPAS